MLGAFNNLGKKGSVVLNIVCTKLMIVESAGVNNYLDLYRTSFYDLPFFFEVKQL